MSRFWDIRAPKPKPRPSPSRTAARRRKVHPSFFLFMVILAIVGIFFLGNGNFQLTQPSKTIVPTTKPTTKSVKISPEINSKVSPEDNLKSTPEDAPEAKNKEDLSIKLVNGSGQTEESNVVQQILENEDFRGLKIENALNLYENSIVYYQDSEIKYANEIADLLKTYNPKIQEFTQETNFDLIIVIGPR